MLACAAGLVLCAALAQGGYPDIVLASGPRGYWRLGELSGATAADAASLAGAPQNGAQPGTYVGGYTLGQPGALIGDSNPATAFDGSSGLVQVSDGYQPTSYTIELWARPDTLRTQSLFVRTSGAGPLNQYSHELLMYDAGGGVYRFAHYSFDGAAKDTRGTSAVSTGVWYHIVGTFTQNGDMRVYVNGLAEGTATGVGTPWNGGDRYLIGSEVGAANFGVRSYFDGLIDEVAFYDRALAPAEILAHYEARIVPEPFAAGLLALGGLALARRRRR